MPQTAQGLKRVRQSERRQLRNKMLLSTLRTSIRRVKDAVANQQTIDEIQKLFLAMVAKIDSSVHKRIIHKNHAARVKRRINQKIRSLSEK